MTKFAVAVVAAAFGLTAVFASSANACISCNYTPEVVNTPVGPQKRAKPAKPQAKKYVPKPQYSARPPKKVVKRPAPVQQAKTPEPAPGAAATSSAGKTTPVEQQAGAGTDTSTAALAETEASEAHRSSGAEGSGCRKFSATAGTTVEVPCE